MTNQLNFIKHLDNLGNIELIQPPKDVELAKSKQEAFVIGQMAILGKIQALIEFSKSQNLQN